MADKSHMGIIFALLVIWLILAVLGFVVKGFLWLALIALAAFVITSVVGYGRRQR